MKEVTIRGREMTMSMAMCRCGSLVAYGVRCCSGMLQDQDRMPKTPAFPTADDLHIS
jgi:hypothetical protein